MKQYLDALRYCYENGVDVESRAGKVRKCFGYQMNYDEVVKALEEEKKLNEQLGKLERV